MVRSVNYFDVSSKTIKRECFQYRLVLVTAVVISKREKRKWEITFAVVLYIKISGETNEVVDFVPNTTQYFKEKRRNMYQQYRLRFNKEVFEVNEKYICDN